MILKNGVVGPVDRGVLTFWFDGYQEDVLQESWDDF